MIFEHGGQCMNKKSLFYFLFIIQLNAGGDLALNGEEVVSFEKDTTCCILSRPSFIAQEPKELKAKEGTFKKKEEKQLCGCCDRPEKDCCQCVAVVGFLAYTRCVEFPFLWGLLGCF